MSSDVELSSAIDDPQRAANGIQLRKTQTGYTWSISVRALSLTREALIEALELATDIDQQMQHRFGRHSARY